MKKTVYRIFAILAGLFVSLGPAFAAGPVFGQAGGVGASSCTLVNGEPGGSCQYWINGSTGVGQISDLSPSKATATGGAALRTLGSHFLDIANPIDFGALPGGSDSGMALYGAIKSTPGFVIINLPYSAVGYTANKLGNIDTTYLYQPADYGSDTASCCTLRDEIPGIYLLNENEIVGTMRYSPQTGHSTFNGTYTNPYNITSGLRMVFDPAAHPNPGPGTTFQGLSVECLPNRPNANDSAASKAAKMRGVLCVYIGNDTGSGGAVGTGYGSEVMNLVQDLNTNSGNILELNHNFNGAVQDNGYSRTFFITGGGNVDNRNTSAIEINHGCYDPAKYCPYGTGVLVRGTVNQFAGQRANPTEGGYFYLGLDETARYIYSVDKQANVRARTLTISTASGVAVATIDPNGYVNVPGIEATDTVQADHQFYAKPRVASSLHGCSATTEGEHAAVTDSRVNGWGMTVTGGGNFHVYAYCDGTSWTVMAK